MYQQTLYKIIDPIQFNRKSRLNRLKKWTYGYHKEDDIIVISKDGTIGDIYEISGLKIAIPKEPKTLKKGANKWVADPVPKELSKINSIFKWKTLPDEFKSKWVPFIESEFDKRENGVWFTNNGVKTYITGSHWMYLKHSKIDVGRADFRESNRIFFMFWEACKADPRSYGMCYLKNRRSGFSTMSSAELVSEGTIVSDKRLGILSKTGPDAKKMFTDKVVPISINYPFYFKPIQDGMDRPKTELAYRAPAQKLTKKSITSVEGQEELSGLDTTIDWKNTGDNSYDGEKLYRLVHDESGKWEKPNNILENWRVTKTCLRLGSKIIGKCLMGSTCNSKAKGGEGFQKLFNSSNPLKRNKNGQTASGLYALFIPMEWNYEGFIDEYGMPVFDTPKDPVFGPDGEQIEIGVIEHWDNEAEGLKDDQDALNEFYRQFPRTIEHAFRDESKNSLYNLAKIYEQIDFNGDMVNSPLITRGSFSWENGTIDSKVKFTPDRSGRFLVSWIPPVEMQNRVIHKNNGIKYPGNEHMGAFGCDSYDISGTVGGGGSNGALHGLTKYSMEEVPTNRFFLQYIARPQTAEIFFEDVLMALVFYGMPMLAENNKPRLLYHLKNRGYRGFSMNRPDRAWNKLSKSEKELGGIPNSSEDVKQAHASAIESYINDYVGLRENGEYGDMYFNETLNDWALFDINNRTKFDASISSGLAIMACNKNRYAPSVQKSNVKVSFGFKKYDNSGTYSKIKK